MAVNVPMAFAADKRDVGRLPEARLVNLFAEAAPTALSKGVVLLPRPGYAAFLSLSSAAYAPIRGIFQQPGTFGGDLLIVANDTLFRVDSAGTATALGVIPGSELVNFASDGVTVRIATGAALYKTDGLTSTFDDADVCSIIYLRGFWFAVRTTTQIVYYLLPGDVAWDPLQFISAESLPDKMAALGLIGDQMAFLGDNTLEIWALTAGSTPPAEPYGGLNFIDKGCLNRSTIANLDNGLIWVASDGVVYICRGGVPERISTNGVEEQIAAADPATLRAWHYIHEGHQFYVLTLAGQGTWVFDISTQFWTTFSSLGQDTWRPSLGAQASWGIIGADDAEATLWALSDELATDDGAALSVQWTALYEHHDRVALRCDRLVVTMSGGWAPATGQGAAPLLELSVSNDQGQTFGAWRQVSTGAIGEYGAQIVFKGLGLIRRPGRVFRFRMSDPCVRRISSVEME